MKRLLIDDHPIERFEILAIHQETRAQVTFAEMNEIRLTVKKTLTNALLYIMLLLMDAQ